MEWRDFITATYDLYQESKTEYDNQNSLWTSYINGNEFNVSKPWVPETPPSIPDEFPLVSRAEPIILGYGYPSSTALDFTSKGRAWGVM